MNKQQTNKQKGKTMKVKVKGLVFVGFAAAILSANAALADPDNTVTSKAYVDNKFQAISDKAQDLTATGETAAAKYPSVAAVKTALDNIPGAEAYTGTGLISVDGHTISTTAEANVLESVSVDGTPLTITNKGVDLGQAAAKDVDTSITAGDTSADVPTTAAVAAFVEGQPGATAYTGTGLITVNDHTISTTAEANVLEGVQIAGVDQTITSKKVNLGAAAGKGADTTITSSATDSNVPTSKAVYDYVDGLPAADIPAMPTQQDDPTGYCDATHPCALVTDSNGAPVWKRIAQQGD